MSLLKFSVQLWAIGLWVCLVKGQSANLLKTVTGEFTTSISDYYNRYTNQVPVPYAMDSKKIPKFETDVTETDSIIFTANVYTEETYSTEGTQFSTFSTITTLSSIQSTAEVITVSQPTTHPTTVLPSIEPATTPTPTPTTTETATPGCNFQCTGILSSNQIAGGEWISFEFSITSCILPLMGLKLRLESAGLQTEDVTASLNCLEEQSTGYYKFNSSSANCPILNLVPCTNYAVTVKTQYEHCEGEPLQFDVWNQPFEPMNVTVDEVTENRIEFSWSFSSARCMQQVNGFNLTIENIDGGESSRMYVSSACYDYSENLINFNTSNPCFCGLIGQCNRYLLEIIPEMNGILHGNLKGQVETVTLIDDENTLMMVETPEFSYESINIRWSFNESRCVNFVDKFTLNVIDRDDSNKETVDADRGKCFNASSGAISFDTASACSNITVDQCTNYFIEIIPNMFGKDYLLKGNSGNTITSPGTTEAQLVTLDAYYNAIAANWTASNPKCRPFITGFQLILNDTYNGPQAQNITIPNNCTTQSEGFVWFSTQSDCFNWTVDPCVDYDVNITPHFYSRFEGGTALGGVSTSPDPTTQTILKIATYSSEDLRFTWTLSDERCLNYVDGFALNVTNLDELQSQISYIPSSCFSISGEEISFDTGSSCSNITTQPCTNYWIQVVPALTNSEELDGDSGSSTTMAESTQMVVETAEYNEESIKFSWTIAVNRCMDYVEGFKLKIVDLTVPTSQIVDVERGTCFDVSSGEVSFDTAGPCSNITVDPCSDYSIEIIPKMFGVDYALPGNNGSTTTAPGADIAAEILTLEADGEAISITWRTSQERCHQQIAGFLMKLQNSTATQAHNVSISCAEDLGSAISFSTQADCSLYVVEPCVAYNVAVTPYFFDKFMGTTATGNVSTLFDPDALMILNTDEFNVGSIKFAWSLDEPRCLKFFDGFTFNLIDLVDFEIQREFIGDDCFAISTEEEISFDTASPCSNFTVKPCTNYSIEIFPQYLDNDYHFSGNTQNTTTSPGDTYAEITSSTTDDHSITFSWRASNERCFPHLNGFWLTLRNEYNDSQAAYVPLECTSVASDTVSFSTDSDCSAWIVQSCFTYELEITPHFFDEFPGINTSFSVNARANSSMVMDLNITETGSESLSMSWTLSQGPCVKFVDDFMVQVTDLTDNQGRSCTVSEQCFTIAGEWVYFDTRCDSCFKISACRNYSLRIVPTILGDSFPDLGQNSIDISTVPGPDITAVFVSMDAGVNWISFSWAASKPTCRHFVSGFNVTLEASNVIQEIPVSDECFTISTDGVVAFNSSSSCTGSAEVDPCSNYIVTIVPLFYDLYSGTAGISSVLTDPGIGDNQISDLASTNRSMDSISLHFKEPKCIDSADLRQYLVTIQELWDSSTQRILFVPRSCVVSGSLTVGPATCNSPTSDARFSSCSPYRISVLPLYGMEQINPTEQVSTDTFTEKGPLDAIVSEFKTVESVGSDSIHLQWQRPRCRYRIETWDFSVSNRGTKSNFSIPYNCPSVSGEIFTFLLSENVSCASMQVVPQILPCSSYNVQLVAEFTVVASDGPAALNYTTPSEEPGRVTNVTYQTHAENQSLEMSWNEPLEHPQCVEYYRTLLRNKSYTYELSGSHTRVLFTQLNPCSTYDVTVFSIGMPRSPTEVSFQIGPFEDGDCGNNALGLALGLTFAVLFVAVVCGVIYKYRDRAISEWSRYRQGAQRSAPSVSVPSKAIEIHQFSARLRELEADGGLGFHNEFKAVQSYSATIKETRHQGEAPANATKNRYTNVLPYDRTRVKLSKLLGDPSSDYINASFITGYRDTPDAYIAAQGPVEATVSDFWRTVWEKNVFIIVMVTSLEERGKNKCARYWPTQGREEHDDYSVTLEGEIHENAFVKRKFKVAYANDSRIVWQLHFTNWPDFGSPVDPADMIEYITTIRLGHGRLGADSPILVHCSAGIGRSGTFIALDILMKSAEKNQQVDVLKTVASLRKERPGMVQTEDQYQFIYSCLEYYIQNRLENDIRPGTAHNLGRQLEARNPTFNAADQENSP